MKKHNASITITDRDIALDEFSMPFGHFAMKNAREMIQKMYVALYGREK